MSKHWQCNVKGPFSISAFTRETSCTPPWNPCVQAAEGGSIDPFVFTDNDGKRWLLFKNDGNAVGKRPHIYICPLTPDALQVRLY